MTTRVLRSARHPSWLVVRLGGFSGRSATARRALGRRALRPARCARGSLRLGAPAAVVGQAGCLRRLARASGSRCSVCQGRRPAGAPSPPACALSRCCPRFSLRCSFHRSHLQLRLRRARLLASALGAGRQKLSTIRCPPVGLHLLWQSSVCGDGQLDYPYNDVVTPCARRA